MESPVQATSALVGHPGFCLTPVVIAHTDVPKITEPRGVPPELVLLSAVAHPGPDVVAALTATVMPAPEEMQRLYLTLILATWPRALRRFLEASMRPELDARLKEIGFAAGEETGREMGRDEGREAMRATALELAELRGVLSTDHEVRIRAQTDIDVLRRVVIALAKARDVDEANAALGPLSQPASTS